MLVLYHLAVNMVIFILHYFILLINRQHVIMTISFWVYRTKLPGQETFWHITKWVIDCDEMTSLFVSKNERKSKRERKVFQPSASILHKQPHHQSQELILFSEWVQGLKHSDHLPQLSQDINRELYHKWSSQKSRCSYGMLMISYRFYLLYPNTRLDITVLVNCLI